MGEVMTGIILTIALFCTQRVVVDGHLACPRGTYVEGVRPSGETRCRPAPPPNCGEPSGPYRQPCPPDASVERVQLYCTGGSHPIVVDDRTVGCQR